MQTNCLNFFKMGRYVVKCDLCKKTIKTTDDVFESYHGGMCKKCRADQKEIFKERLNLNWPHGIGL